MKEIYQVDYSKSGQLLPLEAQVLQQYQILAIEMNKLQQEIDQLIVKDQFVSATSSTHTLLENLRNLEMKINLIHTLFKSSVYSLFESNMIREE